MKRFTAKKWLACLLALCMLLALCACGGKKTTPASHGDPKAVMAEAAEKLNGVKSLSFDMEIKMAFSAEGQSMDLGMTTSAETILDPMVSHSTTSIEMFGIEVESYMVKQGDQVITYSGMKQGSEVVGWSKTTVSADDLEAIQSQMGSYDAQDSFNTQLNLVDNLKEVGAEKVNGKSATRYDGVIHGKDIGKALGSTGAGETLESLGMDPDSLTQDIPISIWIYEDGMPAKYDFDMTDLMAQLLAQSEETQEAEVSAVRLTLTITGVNSVSEIVIPQEALDAPEE